MVSGNRSSGQKKCSHSKAERREVRTTPTIDDECCNEVSLDTEILLYHTMLSLYLYSKRE